MRYYFEADVNEMTRDKFEDLLREAIKDGRQFIVKGIAKDAFLLKVGLSFGVAVTDEQAGRLFANIISQIDNAIDHA